MGSILEQLQAEQAAAQGAVPGPGGGVITDPSAPQAPPGAPPILPPGQVALPPIPPLPGVETLQLPTAPGQPAWVPPDYNQLPRLVFAPNTDIIPSAPPPPAPEMPPMLRRLQLEQQAAGPQEAVDPRLDPVSQGLPIPNQGAATGRFNVNMGEALRNLPIVSDVRRHISGSNELEVAGAMENVIREARMAGSDVALPERVMPPGGTENFLNPPGLDPTGGMARMLFGHQPEGIELTRNPFAGRPVAELEAEVARLRGVAQARRNSTGFDQSEQQIRAADEAVPPWRTLGEGLTALAGQVVGGIPDPRNLIPLPGRAAQWVERAAEGTVGRVARSAAAGTALQTGVQFATAPHQQENEIALGERRGMSVWDAAYSSIVGGLIGGALHATPDTLRFMGVLRNRRAADTGRPVGDITPAEMEQHGSQYLQPGDLEALAAANRIEPNTPQYEQLRERLEQRRRGEADPAERIRQAEERPASDIEGGTVVPPDEQPRTSTVIAGRETSAQVEAQRQNLRDVEEQQGRGAAELPALPLTPSEIRLGQAPVDPATGFPVGPRIEQGTGRVLPDAATRTPGATGAPGTRAGVELRGRGNLPAVVEQQPTRMSDVEVRRAQRDAGTTGQPREEAPPAVVPPGRQAQLPADVEAQARAGEAFDVADAQRQRYEGAVTQEATTDVAQPRVDPTAAGRMEGPGRQQVLVVGDQPVREVGRSEGGRVLVEPFDPRTGEAVPGAHVMAVAPEHIEVVHWTPTERMAQDVTERARPPRTERGVGAEPMAGPQGMATQDIASRQVGGLRGEVLPPEAGAAPEAPRGREGPIIEGEAARTGETAPGVTGQFEDQRFRQPAPEPQRQLPAPRPPAERPASPAETAAQGLREGSNQLGQVRDQAVGEAMRSEASPELQRIADQPTPEEQAAGSHAIAREILADRAARRATNEAETARRAEAPEAERPRGQEQSPPAEQPRPGEEPQAPRAQEERAPQERPPKEAAIEGEQPAPDQAAPRDAAPAREGEPSGEREQPTSADPTAPRGEAPAGEPATIAGRDAASEATMEAMRAEPPKGEPPTPRSAEDFRATFYSNPIFDPKLWQALGRGLVSTLGLPKAAAEQVVRLLRMTDTGAQAVNIGAQISRTARDLNAYLFRSTDARIRTLAGRAEADKLPITSRIIREIANELHALAGNAGEATKEALHEAVQSRVLRRLNHLGDMLDAVYRMPEAARRAAMTEIDRLVRNPRSIRNDGTPVHKAAAGIRALMREELEYRRAAGIDMGEVKDGYMPRVLERERAINDPKAFMRSATEAYRKMGMSRVEAADAAERWLANLHLDEYGLKGPNDFSSTGGTGKPQSTKERVLNRAAEEVMRRDGWYMQDVGQSIADYITRGTKHAEFARRFGPNLEKWNGWREQILKEGGAEYLPTLAGLVQSSAGLNQTIANHAVRSTVTGLKTLGAIVYLAHSPFSSLAEQTAGAIVRTANVADGLRNTVYTIRNLANRIPGLKNMTETQRSQQWVRLSEDLGAVSAGQELIAMSLLTSRTELPSARGITTKFLRPLSILTDAQRTATTQLGDLFFHRLAARVGDAGDTLTRQLLREHGIPDAQQAAFAKWMQTGRAGDLTIPAPGHAMGDLYRTAMGRFINGVILAPTPAMKTALANHPIGSLVTQLGSFNQAWFQQMFMRAARMAKQSVTGADLRFLDRVRLMTPMALGVPISVALGYGVQRLKEKIYASGVPPQQERTTGENILQAVSQVGLTGSADVLYNTMMPMIQGHLGIGTPGQGARYQRDPLTVMSGPVPGAINEAFSTMVNMWSDRNSPNTNNAERRLGRVAWNLGVAPVVGTGMALMRGGGGLLGQAAIQAVYHPWVREQAIRAVAGPPAPPRAQGVYHPLPPSVRPVAPR